MLRHLRVTNFAILSDVALELGPGMNVLTGETGAGKSLIVEAVNLLRGGRASADIPRAGADEAVVEAIFEVPADLRGRVYGVLEAAGLPASAEAALDDGEDGEAIFIRRVIQRGGRSRTYVNGALTTAARLAELGALLVDLSGQHQHQGLVDASRHRELLDAFCALGAAGAPAGEADLGVAMAERWAALRACSEELEALGGDERAREARLDYLKFQLEELDAAAFEPDEDLRVERERGRLASVDLLTGAVRAAEEALYGGDDSARDRVAAAAREIERALRADPSLESVARQLGEVETLISDAADSLRSYADKLEGDPERLAWLDERVALIRRLVRKHAASGFAASGGGGGRGGGAGAGYGANGGGAGAGYGASSRPTGGAGASDGAGGSAGAGGASANGPVAGAGGGGDGAGGEGGSSASVLGPVLAKAAELRRELESLVGRDARLAELGAARENAEVAARAAAAALAKVRAKAAKKLEKEVGAALAELGMGSARLSVAIEAVALGPTGGDRIELMLASNKGEDVRPLTKVASGGELSRIMLALKLALRRADEVATYVFDEVDTGIGGATASVVGSQIRRVADERQVLCVTHLPQLAAFADHHFHVEKTEVAGRTETRVAKLTATARKDELARMLGGSATSKAKAHAAELLSDARRRA